MNNNPADIPQTGDFLIEFRGSVCLVRPTNPACRVWLEQHTTTGNGEAMWWGGALVVDPRCLDTLVDGLIAHGFTPFEDETKHVATDTACPHCSSIATNRHTFAAQGAVPEVSFRECEDCGHQWDHA